MVFPKRVIFGARYRREDSTSHVQRLASCATRLREWGDLAAALKGVAQGTQVAVITNVAKNMAEARVWRIFGFGSCSILYFAFPFLSFKCTTLEGRPKLSLCSHFQLSTMWQTTFCLAMVPVQRLMGRVDAELQKARLHETLERGDENDDEDTTLGPSTSFILPLSSIMFVYHMFVSPQAGRIWTSVSLSTENDNQQPSVAKELWFRVLVAL